jgi:uncharacterized protein YdeI (YjbR/CyaY-like superfamily)
MENKSRNPDYPIISFASQTEFTDWMTENHDKENGIWLRFYKKNSGVATVVYSEALDVALCFGWIDGQLKKMDDNSYIQKFTPRRAKSIWSKRNREHIGRLEKEGRMQPAGIREVEAAKRDGRWETAYDSPGNMEIPQEFMNELSKNQKALAFFNTLNKTNLFAIGWRLQTAKTPETKEKRILSIIDMLEKGKKFH